MWKMTGVFFLIMVVGLVGLAVSVDDIVQKNLPYGWRVALPSIAACLSLLFVWFFGGALYLTIKRSETMRVSKCRHPNGE